MIHNRFNDVPHAEIVEEANDLMAEHITAIRPEWVRFRLLESTEVGYYCSVYVNPQDVPLNHRHRVLTYAHDRRVFRKVVISPPPKTSVHPSVELLYVTMY